MKFFSIVLGVAAVAALAAAYRVSGSLDTKNEFNLLGRFTFSTLKQTEGLFFFSSCRCFFSHSLFFFPPLTDDLINITYTAKEYNSGHAYFVLYYDVADSWGANYNNKTRTCMEKRNSGATRPYVIQKGEGQTHSYHPKDYVRPHIWYVVALNCPNEGQKEPERLKLDYKIHFVNKGNSEAGFDESGMLALNAVYFVFFAILGVVHGLAVYFLFRRGVAHPIVMILLGVIGFIVLSLFFVMIHWGVYNSNGVGANGCRVFGQLLMGVANIAFAMLLVTIASGWSITYYDLPRKKQILLISVIYCICYLLIFIISASTGLSAASTQFVYAKGALLFFVVIYILLCWIGVWAYFAFSLFRTWREEALYDKRLFYLIFGIGYSAWFVLPALLNFISMGVAEWYRPRVVDAFQLTSTFIGVAALVVLLWPSRVEKYFRINAASSEAEAATQA